jgi:predicted GNAT family acetyltransferase
MILFIHTEVDPAFQGQGLASQLAAGALADAVATGDTIVPYCPTSTSTSARTMSRARRCFPTAPDGSA